MPYLKSQEPRSGLLELFRAYPDTAKTLLEFHESVMRGPSPLTEAERELIAAYVSGVNACDYCHGVHSRTAAAFGVPESVLAVVIFDLESAPIDSRMKPLLRYLAKLTLTPDQVTEEDAAAVFAAGWDDRALHDAVFVCGIFNMMNRLVMGLGIEATPDYYRESAKRLHEIGYAGLAAMITE
jgi:uncharacterized peroxidase-related enzyme